MRFASSMDYPSENLRRSTFASNMRPKEIGLKLQNTLNEVSSHLR